MGLLVDPEGTKIEIVYLSKGSIVSFRGIETVDIKILS